MSPFQEFLLKNSIVFTGHLTHSGLRQRFLYNLNEGREEEILQQDELTTAEMLEEEVHYVRAVSSCNLKCGVKLP